MSARLGYLIGFAILCLSGCGGYSALSSGSTFPDLEVAGWTNGGPPSDLNGNVVVLEVFATW